MGYTISCDLTLGEQHPASYCWPLIFELLRCHDFTFDNPWFQPSHQGSFMRFTHAPDRADEGVVPVEAYAMQGSSFHALWDVISTTASDSALSVAPTFWSTRPNLEGWDVVCHLYRQRLSCWTSSLGLTGGSDVPPELILAERSEALSRYVVLACDFFVEVGASEGEFIFERYGVIHRFGAIGIPLTLEWWGSPSSPEPYGATVSAFTLSNTSTLTIVNLFNLIAKDLPIPLDLPY